MTARQTSDPGRATTAWPMPQRGRWALVGIAAAGVAVIATGTILPWNGPWPDPSPADTLRIAVLTVTTGLWLAAALLACWNDAASPMWILLLAYVVADWIWAIGFFGTSLLWTISDTFSNLATAVLVHVLVAFPSGRLVTRRDRALVAFVYVFSIVTNVVSHMTWDVTFTCDPVCLQNAFFVWKNDGLHGAIDMVNAIAVPIVGLIVAAVVIGHWRAAGPAGRRVLLPALVALPFAYVTNVVFYVGRNTDNQALMELGNSPLALALSTVVPVGVLIGIARSRLRRAAVTDLLEALGRGIPLGGLRDVLSRAVGDPTLQLAFGAPSGGGFVDASGQAVDVDAGGARRLHRIERGDDLVAVIVHDPEIEAEHPGLVRAVGSAAMLAIENERLSAQVRAQLDEVRASRARIVEAGDAERRRIERDLHDGAQQRLVALALRLETARATAGGTASLLDEATRELLAAVGEVRDLARGLHPPILPEAGLGAAVEALVERMSVPVDVDLPQGRFPADVESAAYFVVAEALTNVVRSARAAHARVEGLVRTDPETLSITVSDDGIGGADASRGSGLAGLADRVAAIGGRLRIESRPGDGTTIEATIPVDRR